MPLPGLESRLAADAAASGKTPAAPQAPAAPPTVESLQLENDRLKAALEAANGQIEYWKLKFKQTDAVHAELQTAHAQLQGRHGDLQAKVASGAGR